MNKQEIQNLAENALHEACFHIQEALGITNGQNASIFFSGEREDIIYEIFSKYIQDELMIKTYEMEIIK
jgi:hypothetical protein